MPIIFRTTENFMTLLRSDLSRPHPFAHERVGFISVRAAKGSNHLVLLANNYHPVADADYLPDPDVGAMMSADVLRKALEIALLNPVGMFHVHMHLLSARLWFSPTDLREQLRYMPDFFKVRHGMPHGAIVLNSRSAAGRVWLGPTDIVHIDEFNIVGSEMKIARAAHDGSTDFYV